MPTIATARAIIVNYNGVPYVSSALESLQRQDEPCEIVVVDNASTDDSVMMLQRYSGITVRRNSHNGGFGAAVNLAAKECEADYIALLNPDAVAAPQWLSTITHWMRQNDIDIASSTIAGSTGLYFAGGDWNAFRGAALERTTYQGPITDWISGCAMVIRRGAFESLNGFDEGFFLYSEDVDLSLRARRRGFRIGVLEQTLVEHPEHGRSSAGFWLRKMIVAHESKGRLIAKHCPAFSRPLALFIQGIIAPLIGGIPAAHLATIAAAVWRGYAHANAGTD